MCYGPIYRRAAAGFLRERTVFKLYVTNPNNDGWWFIAASDRLSDLIMTAKVFNAQAVATKIEYPPNWKEVLAARLVESGDLDSL